MKKGFNVPGFETEREANRERAYLQAFNSMGAEWVTPEYVETAGGVLFRRLIDGCEAWCGPGHDIVFGAWRPAKRH